MPRAGGPDSECAIPPSRGLSVDAHGPINVKGWRRVWRVARLILVLAAVLVAVGNLARCLPERTANGAVRTDHDEPVAKPGANNPSSSDPSKTVRFGQQSSDEMMTGYVEYDLSGVKPSGPNK